MAITILHLSDVHLGNDWIPRAILTLRPWWKPVDKGITAGLIEVIRETKPDYIVLSGDIVNKPQKAMFEKAAHYLRSVFTDAGFDFMRRLLVVAGNHDVGFFPQKQPDDSKRLKNYRGFLQALYGENDVENRMFHFVHHDAGLRVIFAPGFDDARSCASRRGRNRRRAAAVAPISDPETTRATRRAVPFLHQNCGSAPSLRSHRRHTAQKREIHATARRRGYSRVAG